MYTDKVMDHFSNPRNVGEIEDADGVGEVGNASCGDIMKIFLKVEDDVIKEVKFKTFGCGAAIATSSMVTELAIGKTPVAPGKAVKKGKTFENVFWRLYVKHQDGWQGGGPAKMSRAMIFNAGNWSQAMISHVWGSGSNLTLDPVRAASGTSATTSRRRARA